MEIMWPVLLFMGLVWLRRVNPLYRQHECEDPTPEMSQSTSVFINVPTAIASLYPQATSLTRPCPPLVSYLGSKESSAMPTTLVFNTPPVENLPVLCPTTTTPCKDNELEVETALTILLTVLYLYCTCAPFLHLAVSSLSKLYWDVQELLLSDPEFQHVGRLWKELNSMSNFMDTLRTRPEMVSGQWSGIWWLTNHI